MIAASCKPFAMDPNTVALPRPNFWEETDHTFPSAAAALRGRAANAVQPAELGETYAEDASVLTFYELCREGRRQWMATRPDALNDIEKFRKRKGDEALVREFLNALTDRVSSDSIDDVEATIHYARVAQKLVLKLAPHVCGEPPSRKHMFKSNDPHVRLKDWINRMVARVNKSTRGRPDMVVRPEQVQQALRRVDLMAPEDFGDEEDLNMLLRDLFPLRLQIALIPAPWTPVWCAENNTPNWYQTVPEGWEAPEDDDSNDNENDDVWDSHAGGARAAQVIGSVGLCLVIALVSASAAFFR